VASICAPCSNAQARDLLQLEGCPTAIALDRTAIWSALAPVASSPAIDGGFRTSLSFRHPTKGIVLVLGSGVAIEPFQGKLGKDELSQMAEMTRQALGDRDLAAEANEQAVDLGIAADVQKFDLGQVMEVTPDAFWTMGPTSAAARGGTSRGGYSGMLTTIVAGCVLQGNFHFVGAEFTPDEVKAAAAVLATSFTTP
jgi:hypothetical protein